MADPVYNLVSALYHGLKQAQAGLTYAADAREAGEMELANFFDELAEQGRDQAARAKTLLAARLGTPHAGRDVRVDEASKDSFPASDAPAY